MGLNIKSEYIFKKSTFCKSVKRFGQINCLAAGADGCWESFPFLLLGRFFRFRFCFSLVSSSFLTSGFSVLAKTAKKILNKLSSPLRHHMLVILRGVSCSESDDWYEPIKLVSALLPDKGTASASSSDSSSPSLRAFTSFTEKIKLI